MTHPQFPADFARISLDNSCWLAFGDQVLEVAPAPTREWLAALAAGDLERIVPRMLEPQDRQWVYRSLMDDLSGVDAPLVTQAAKAVVSAVCGIPWYGAVRLAHLAQQQWFQLDPLLLNQGVDMFELAIGRVLSCVYLLNTQHAEEAQRAVFDRDLWAPPESEKPAWSAQQQSSSFASFRAMRQQFTK